MYNLICIIGKSGSGKDTIFNKILTEGANKNLPLHQVIGCTTINVFGKMKRLRGRPGRTASYKKAIVRLAHGETIKVFEGA